MLTRKQLRFLDSISPEDLRKYLKQTDRMKTAGWFDDSVDYLKRNYDYAKYLGKHKFYVAKAGLQLDIPPMTLAVHDWAKFTPTEFPVYRDWFYSNKGMKGDRSLFKPFREAVQHHYDKASFGHHYYKSGTPSELVPYEYKLETLADWYSVMASNWQGPGSVPTFKEWYKQNRDRLPLDPLVRSIADQKLIYGL